MYLAVCERNAKKEARTFSSSEEHYDYAISLLNTGFYDEAREQFEAILEDNPDADYALYGFAILESMTGQVDGCLEHLGRAIYINPRVTGSRRVLTLTFRTWPTILVLPSCFIPELA